MRAAAAQPQAPTREQQQRRIVLPLGPDEPVPEIRVAAHVATYLRFDAPIDGASVEVEGRAAHLRLVDPGERTLTLEPAVDLDAGKKLRVRVRYKDGASPAHATFWLVTQPTRVDKEVEVVRRPRTVEALEAALAGKEAELAALRASRGPAALVFSGHLDSEGVRARCIEYLSDGAQNGLKVTQGMGYRARSWALAVIRVRNLPGQKPWVPTEARLLRPDGASVKLRSVEMDRARLGPGEEGLAVVETEAPSWEADEVLRLELLDERGGRHLFIPEVKL